MHRTHGVAIVPEDVPKGGSSQEYQVQCDEQGLPLTVGIHGLMTAVAFREFQTTSCAPSTTGRLATRMEPSVQVRARSETVDAAKGKVATR